MPGTPTQTRIDNLERTLQALDLRRKGYSYVQIAAIMGYAYASGAEKAVRRALKYVIREPAEAVRKLELDRLDSMLQAIWPRVQRGDLLAMDRALRIEERRAKLLGLDTIDGDRGPLIIQVVEGHAETTKALPDSGSRPSTIDETQSIMDFEPEEEEEIPIEVVSALSNPASAENLRQTLKNIETLQDLEDLGFGDDDEVSFP